MFGEDYNTSESPRVSSPWDPFLPSPPSEPGSLESRKQLHNGIPKLAPEVEEGNIEYKLKLADITPARFARLVTQLKWRLLEGGGQAYYELGVADSGALIGLSRSDLEQSLETLEMMAGEIGASVIVVKEIEVPPAMVALADKVSAYIDPETGEWTEKMCNKRRRIVPRELDNESVAASVDRDSETDFTDFTDTDESSSLISTPNFPPQVGVAHAALVPYAHRVAPSHPNRPTAQSSPAILPIDDDLALFSMEPEPSLDIDDADTMKFSTDVLADVPDFSLDIEITPVYKPRPIRRPDYRAPTIVGRPARRLPKDKYKDKKLPQPSRDPLLEASAYERDSVPVQNKQEAKAVLRRIARDRRREERRKALLVASAVSDETISAEHSVVDQHDSAPAATIDVDVAVVGLEALHVGVQSVDAAIAANLTVPAEEDSQPAAAASIAGLAVEAVPLESKEPRLIVEALVVRKLSLEEDFLDFGNLGAFSLS